MMTKTAGALAIFASCTFIGAAGAQDLGPQVKKLADGVYVHTGRGGVLRADPHQFRRGAHFRRSAI
jgi:hypothetical protein